jgi:hypothetical protein
MLFPASCIDVYVDEASSSSEPFSTSTPSLILIPFSLFLPVLSFHPPPFSKYV